MNFLQSIIERNFRPDRGPVTGYQGMPSEPFMSALPQDEIARVPAASMQVPQMEQIPQLTEMKPQRSRMSFLDTIGRISDVIARVGGAEAMYQPSLDAIEAKRMAEEDRARMVDLEGLRRKQAEMQIAAGETEAQDTERSRIGQALGAVAGNPNAVALWPQIAQQAGIDAQKAAAIGEIIGRNPQAAETLAMSLGWSPAKQGSQAKELQIYKLLEQESPEMAQAYLAEIANPGTLTDYQKGQLDAAFAKIASGERIAGARIASSERNVDRRIAASGAKGAGAKGGSQAAMIQTAQGNLDELRGIYDELNNMGAMVSPSRGAVDNIGARVRASGLGQMVEGAVGTEAQTLRDRIESIRPGLMQSLAKATGMTGKQLDSNADVKLFMQTVTNPAASYEANIAAIRGLERFLAANAQPEAPAAPSRPAPRRKVNPPRRGNSSNRPSVSNW